MRAEALIVSGIFLGILSCAPIAPDRAPIPEDALSRSLPSGELVRTLARRAHEFRSLRTLATVHYRGTDGRGTFQEAILVERPGRLRLETLSPLGAILIVTVEGEEVAGFQPREALFFRGRSSKENLMRLIQVPLELKEITSLLMGLPPVNLQGGWEEEGHSLYLAPNGGRRERVVFDPTQIVPIRWERRGSDGWIELSAHFSDFSATPAGLFPRKIYFEAHPEETRLEIFYQEPEVNIEIPLALFFQQRPENVREVPLESLGPSP